jgi:hypothetical protein
MPRETYAYSVSRLMPSRWAATALVSQPVSVPLPRLPPRLLSPRLPLPRFPLPRLPAIARLYIDAINIDNVYGTGG